MKLNQKTYKQKKGITLVALVITIVILLILAGISIAQLTGNGLFENAKLAKEKSDNAQQKENDTLSDYESKIGEYIDGTRNENANNYSTEEQIIGNWIDGKTLYQKTIDCGTLPNNTNISIPSNVENIEHLVYIGGIAFSNTSTIVKTLPSAHYDSMYSILLDFRDNNNIFIGTKYNYSSYRAYVTIRYTKKD